MRLGKYILITVGTLAALIFVLLYVGVANPRQDVAWGVNFSEKHTINLHLDWKNTYLAILDDLKARKLKVAVHWDFVEPKEKEFSFADLDWQMSEAGKRGAGVVLAIGMKTPRWPECHIPDWAKSMDKQKQQDEITAYLQAVVARYKSDPALKGWQVENEPYFQFGDCPWKDDAYLEKEVALVRSLDPAHPILITDSGEYSTWFKPARLGDVVGSTLYRTVWFKQLGMYADYLWSPLFYKRHAELIKLLFDKDVIDAELQAEPWGPVLYYDMTVAEQMKSISVGKLRANIDFARRTDMKEAYFWGAEWWYWMKTTQNDPSFWNEAKKVF